jgi:hypothetical protein
MEDLGINFNKLFELMPPGWEAKAKELKAFIRPREVKSPADLLRVILLYMTSSPSFKKTSVILQLSGQIDMNKTATYNRIKKSEVWLKWLCENICRRQGLLAIKPEWLTGKDVFLIDASDEPVYGSKQADFRLHYCIDLFTLAMHEMLLSNVKLGEKLTNFGKIDNNSVIVADRAYGTISGIEYLRQHESDFVIRLRSNSFNLYKMSDNQAVKVDLLTYFDDLKEFESGSVNLYYKIGDEYKPIRICATTKNKESERKGLEHLKKSNNKEMRGKVSETQMLFNRYIIVATSFSDDVPAKSIMELYRMRWQIEIAFKRLKSLFHYNEIPSKLDAAARAWFYGKLLIAAVSEAIVNDGRFSPLAN